MRLKKGGRAVLGGVIILGSVTALNVISYYGCHDTSRVESCASNEKIGCAYDSDNKIYLNLEKP